MHMKQENRAVDGDLTLAFVRITWYYCCWLCSKGLICSIFLLVSREIMSFIYHFYVIGHCLETEMSQSEKYLLWLGFWPGSCMPRWCAVAPTMTHSSGPSACRSLAPGSGRRWRGGSTAPCTLGFRLAVLEHIPLEALALETLLHTILYYFYFFLSLLI